MRRCRFAWGIAGALVLAGCTGSADEGITTTTVPVVTTGTSSVAATTTPAPTTMPPATTTSTSQPYLAPNELVVEAFPVPAGSRPHDVAPAADGGIWYTAQGSGELGWLDPATGDTSHIALGSGSRPHGVIVDDAGEPWITDGGLNAIVTVDPDTDEVITFPLPAEHPDANLNTAVFDETGTLWFTGQGGIYGSLDPTTGEMVVYEAPRGRGPYGITATPEGAVYYASLAGSYVGLIEEDGAATVLEPPTAGQGARRVWADSQGAVWVSEWNTGALSRYSPATGEWDVWPLPGGASAYAVYVDAADIVWVSDFGGDDALVRFDSTTEQFTAYPLPHANGEVRQLHGRPGEVWGAESATDHLVVIRTR